MAGHRQPTSRDPYEMCPFRETFLLHLTEPAHESALRTLGNLLFQFAHEWPFFPQHTEPVIAVELRAVVTDLRHVGVFLAETVPTNIGGGDDSRWERVLATRAEAWGAQSLLSQPRSSRRSEKRGTRCTTIWVLDLAWKPP